MLLRLSGGFTVINKAVYNILDESCDSGILGSVSFINKNLVTMMKGKRRFNSKWKREKEMTLKLCYPDTCQLLSTRT